MTDADGDVVIEHTYSPYGEMHEIVRDASAFVDAPPVGFAGRPHDGVANNVLYVHGPGIDEPLARIDSDGSVRYYHADAQGTILSLVDESAVIKTRYKYTVYGAPTVVGEASGNPYMYTGREYDFETGLYFFRNRYQSPILGRFISEDPIGVQAGLNFYAYVGNNPVNFTDPWGLEIKYNKPAPYTVPPTGKTLEALECLDNCLNKVSGMKETLITGGSEKNGHSKGSLHYDNKACDIAGPRFNKTTTGNVNSCATQCGFTHGQYEDYPGDNKDHWHLQRGEGLGVPKLPDK